MKEKIQLSTLDSEGGRKWVYPLLAAGKWFHRRAVVAAILIAWLLIAPWIQVQDKQGLFFDLVHDKIDFLGFTFWINETPVFLSFVLALFAGILLFTAVFGRIFCGWACPFPVFLEFAFRPIERWLEGAGASQKLFLARPLSDRLPQFLAKWFLFIAISFVVANTFVAYFFGSHRLIEMIQEGPILHWKTFLGVSVATAAMVFQYGWFREQICLFVCPYGRLQSILLDKDSIIVAYDSKRGEPRGRAGKTSGDCVDCKLCVHVCPTGIDIRQGLQLECLHCTQCIDACDSIMTKFNRPPGLIRYQTENEVEGKPRRILRPRPAIYSSLLLVASIFLVSFTAGRKEFSATLHRQSYRDLYTRDDAGLIQNEVRLHILNKSDTVLIIQFKPLSPEGLQVISPQGPAEMTGGSEQERHLILKLPSDAFKNYSGSRLVRLQLIDQNLIHQDFEVQMLGPDH